MADGARHSMAFVEESTYGLTPATPSWTNIRHLSTSLDLSKDTLTNDELRNDRQITDVRHGSKQVAGDIGVNLSCASFDALLEAVLCGTWATNKLKAGTTRRSFTIERKFDDIADKPFHRYTGCEFNSLAIQLGANALVPVTFGVMGKDRVISATEVTGSVYGAATTTEALDSFSGTLDEGGSTIGIVTELALNLDNGMSTKNVVMQDTTNQHSIGRSNVSGTVTVYFENSVMLEKFVNETVSSLDVTVQDGAGNSLRFYLPRIKYNGAPVETQGEGPITIALPFQALRDNTEATNIVIDRVNV